MCSRQIKFGRTALPFLCLTGERQASNPGSKEAEAAKKILLVGDSKSLRLTMERAMVRVGYAVCSADDGEQALQMALLQSPDLILLDMLLPKISGQEVLRILKKDAATAEVPVVDLTGLSA